MQTHDSQKITTALTLSPETIFRARKESDPTLTLGLGPGFLVDITQHKHLSGIGVLHDNRRETSDGIETQHGGRRRRENRTH